MFDDKREDIMSKCIYCQEEILDNSKYCKHCNHYQSWWKNWVAHIGGVVALVVVIVSIATYAIKPLRDAYTVYTWRDKVEVVTFHSTKGITVNNSGDGDIFLESVSYKSGEIKFSGGKPIMMPAKKGEFTSCTFEGIKEGKVVVMGEKTDKKTTFPVIIDENNFEYKLFKTALKDRLLTFPCEAELLYRSLIKNKKHTVKISCIGYYYKQEEANPRANEMAQTPLRQ